MTKPEARRLLVKFVRFIRVAGTSYQDAVDNFDLCLGLDNINPEIGKAYSLVPEVYPHVVAWVYTFRADEFR